MLTCLKYAQIFWVVAIFLMAGGQALDAYQDIVCVKEHASERQTSDSKTPNCPANHTCCHFHTHMAGAFLEASSFVFSDLISVPYFDRSDAVVEGPVREIDYPPQLS